MCIPINQQENGLSEKDNSLTCDTTLIPNTHNSSFSIGKPLSIYGLLSDTVKPKLYAAGTPRRCSEGMDQQNESLQQHHQLHEANKTNNLLLPLIRSMKVEIQLYEWFKRLHFMQKSLQHHIKLTKPKSDNDYWMMNLSESRY